MVLLIQIIINKPELKKNIQTVEDREYTKEEVKNAIEEQKPKKSPG